MLFKKIIKIRNGEIIILKKSLLRKLAVASFGVLAIAALTAGCGGESKKAPTADGKKTVVKTVISGTEVSLSWVDERG